MHHTRRLRLTASIILCFVLQAQGADKYTDQNRPYEFGFTIDGQQHRHESKDKDGIIMGEFGFITADDVYHVTVYATDKEGRFKILSMKNIHLKSSTASSSVSPKPGRRGKEVGALPLPPASPISPVVQPTQPGKVVEPVSLEPPRGSCSSCSLPTTTTRAPPPVYNQVSNNNNINSPSHFGPQTQNNPSNGSQGGQPNYQGPNQGGPGSNTANRFPQPGGYPSGPLPSGDRTSKQIHTYTNGPPGSKKPKLVTAGMQIVDKNTDINALRPGEEKGLPPGLTQDDMLQLLYTFNYTVGFHAHFEEGYTNGVKQGYYYVTGRNGVRTRIDYVADDTGFHPKVSQEVLDLLSEEVPKPETEKDEKYGLKGYEFKWLYYPVDSKRR